MITSAGEVRVLDFGFARERPLELHSASALSGARIAPAYASVERVNGSEPHPSDDVYSLACIAYELLSGDILLVDDPRRWRARMVGVREDHGLTASRCRR